MIIFLVDMELLNGEIKVRLSLYLDSVLDFLQTAKKLICL